MFEGYLREKAIRMDHTIELGSIPTIKHLVENEVGVTFLPRFGRGGCPGGRAARGAGDRDGGARALGGVRSSQEQVDQPLMACFLEIVTAAGV